MKVIKPITITESMLVSSSAPETDYAAYAPATNYTVGQRVIYLHKIWECVQTPNTGNTPGTDPLYWAELGATNRWLMFDGEVSTQTSVASSLAVTVAPILLANSLALLEVDGTALDVTVTDGPGGPVIYSHSQSLEGSIISDWYQYFYEPFIPLREVLLTDLPAYGSSKITVSVTGLGTINVGAMILGTAYFLGDTQTGASAGITDYSRKDTSAAGVPTFVKRKYSKRMSVQLMLDNAALTKVQRVLADLRATPCVWIGTDVPGYEPLTMFGWYSDFSLDVAYQNVSYCNLEILGLT